MPVAFIVAPYEADAQLAYQSLLYKRTGGKDGVAAIVTEDSDLLAYGASPILYKLDQVLLVTYLENQFQFALLFLRL